MISGYEGMDSDDPTMWTVEDVHKWISLSAKQYNMKPVDLTKFAVDGATLLCFTEEEFKERAGDAGSALHAALYSWTAAMPSVCDVTIAQVASPAESGFASGAEAGESTPLSLHGNMISGYEGMDSDDITVVPLQYNCTVSHIIISSRFTEDDDCDGAEKPAAGGRSGNAHIQLWQFLKELLCDGKHYGACIRWLDRPSGVFKIEDSVRVARLWGRRKNRPAMNYDKLSRSIRQYYKKGIMKKTERSQRLVYQF
ncbi:unnamed protein product [Notodromas monacha]|uniref:Uncharacterized protein n=1 Tax=Notodromas monacha TaxID=399045 RepID=A0A7R9BSC9_9CRUS|nr:unnamed protein product [Notodromas monacha]CAG0920808.1 unnamed protein product [Notodromas monacha]